MKFALTLLLLIIPLGCAASTQPVPQVDMIALANQQLAVAETALTIAKSDGLISDSDWQNLYLPALHSISAALDGWQAATGSDVQKAETAFLSALPSVLQLVDNVQHKRMATTRGSQ